MCVSGNYSNGTCMTLATDQSTCIISHDLLNPVRVTTIITFIFKGEN